MSFDRASKIILLSLSFQLNITWATKKKNRRIWTSYWSLLHALEMLDLYGLLCMWQKIQEFLPSAYKEALFSLSDMFYSSCVAAGSSVKRTTGVWTLWMGTGSVTRLVTCCHYEMSLRTQTSDVWFWYRLMVCNKKEVIWRWNGVTSVLRREEKPEYIFWNSSSLKGSLQRLHLGFFFCLLLSWKMWFQINLSPSDYHFFRFPLAIWIIVR